jgi:hypothetical protein
LQDDIDAGFLFIYKALEEDRLFANMLGRPRRYKSSPAYMSAVLVDNARNFLQPIVVRPVRDEISRLLSSFSSGRAALSQSDFDTKFLSKPKLEPVVFFFVYNMYHHVRRTRFGQFSSLTNNDFMKLKSLDFIFNLCLVIEETLQHRFSRGRANYLISDGVLALAKRNGWAQKSDKDPREHQQSLSNFKTYQDPSVAIPILFAGAINYREAPINSEFRFLLLAWHLRNYSGHNIRTQPLLVRDYDKIFEWLMSALFLALQ